jgi:tRNA pseudouridine38-40 synthase
VMGEHNFRAFSKTNTQVQNFRCHIIRSDWSIAADKLIYNIEGNRFLRGMVRMLTAGMVAVARGKMNMESFSELMKGEGRCGRSAPAEGLYLMRVNYPENYFR